MGCLNYSYEVQSVFQVKEIRDYWGAGNHRAEILTTLFYTYHPYFLCRFHSASLCPKEAK